MLKISKFVIVLLLATLSISFADIHWITDLDKGFKKAQKEKKLILIYVYSPKCHYCKEMERTTFKSKKVQEMIEKYFVPLKIRKCSEDGQFVKMEYGYFGTPTFHFLEPDGTKIKSIFGAWKEKEFLKILEYFAKGYYKKMNMTEYFMRD